MEETREGVIYFVRAIGADAVKVGFSGDLPARLAKLQFTSPLKLELIKSVPATLGMEQTLLNVLNQYQIHGEWFRADPLLLEFIESIPTDRPFSSDFFLKK